MIIINYATLFYIYFKNKLGEFHPLWRTFNVGEIPHHL